MTLHILESYQDDHLHEGICIIILKNGTVLYKWLDTSEKFLKVHKSWGKMSTVRDFIKKFETFQFKIKRKNYYI